MRSSLCSVGMLALVAVACGSDERTAGPRSGRIAPGPSAPTDQAPPATGTQGAVAIPVDPAQGDPGPARPESEPTQPDPEAPPPVSPDACARARACCPAYAAALPNGGDRSSAEQACAALDLVIAAGGAPADEACQGALEGFRRSLEASGRAVPAACR